MGNIALFSMYAFFFSFIAYAVGIFGFGVVTRWVLTKLGLVNVWGATLGGAASTTVAGLVLFGQHNTDGIAPVIGILVSGAVGSFAYYRAVTETKPPPPPAPPS